MKWFVGKTKGLFFLFLFSFFLVVGLSSCGGGGSGGGNKTGSNYSIGSGNHALMGPLVGAKINIYTLDNTSHPINTEPITTDSRGSFVFKNDKNLSDGTLVIVEASGGKDIDVNDDGVLDSEPTSNEGTIHAFATIKDLKDGKVNITLVSEIIYQYSKDLLSDIGRTLNKNDFKNIVDKISTFFAVGTTSTYSEDIEKFNPLLERDRKLLRFNYLTLLKGDGSLAELYHSNKKGKNNIAIENTLSKLFSKIDLSLHDSNLIKLKKLIKVSIVPEHITFSTTGIKFPESEYKTWVKKGSNFTIQIENIDSGYKIIGWHGCDIVSTDLQRCTVSAIQADKIIYPIIVPSKITLKSGITIKDISNAIVDINTSKSDPSTTSMTIYSDLKDTATESTLASMNKGDILVHKTNPVFFGKIDGITKINDFRYNVIIKKVSLLDVIKDGYFSISSNKEGVVGPLIGSTKVISRSIILPNGTKIPFNPNKPAKIKIYFNGEKATTYPDRSMFVSSRNGISVSQKIGGATLTGSLTVTPSVDFDMSWGFYSGINQIYIKPSVKLEDNLSITVAKEWNYNNHINLLKKPLIFTQTFMVGPIPIVLDEPISIYVGADASAKAAINISVKASIAPTIVSGWSKESGASFSLQLPNTLSLSGRIDGNTNSFAYLGVFPSIQIYGLGFGVNNKFGPYETLSGTASATVGTKTTGKLITKAGLTGECGLEYEGNIQISTLWSPLKKFVDDVNKLIKGKYTSFTKKWPYLKIAKTTKAPGNIDVTGDQTIDLSKNPGDNVDILKQYTLKNTGETAIYWTSSIIPTRFLRIALKPFFGELKPGEKVTVDAEISNIESLETLGTYRAFIKFYQSKTASSPVILSSPIFVSDINIKVKPNIDVAFNKQNIKVKVVGSTVRKLEFNWINYPDYSELDGYRIYKGVWDNATNNCIRYGLFKTIKGNATTTYSEPIASLLSSSDYIRKIVKGQEYCFYLTGYKNYTYVDGAENMYEFPLQTGISKIIPAPTGTGSTSSTELDVMFVVDVSGSFGPDISTFVANSENIVTSLKSALPKGAVLKVGLSSFSDYPTWDGDASDYPYKLGQSLTTDTNKLKTALEGLRILDGGDVPESQLEALYQTINSPDVGWNKSAIKLILLYTDANFHDPDKHTADSSYPGPGSTEVKKDLNLNNISVIGLGAGGIPSDLKNISDWSFELKRDSSEIVDKIKTIIEAIPGTTVITTTRSIGTIRRSTSMHKWNYLEHLNN